MRITKHLAEMVDLMVDIRCDWATGDCTAFSNWLAQFVHPDTEGLVKRLANPTTDLETIEVAISDCGGGSDAIRWYEIEGLIIGVCSMGAEGWVLTEAALATMPAIHDYQSCDDA